VKTVGVEAKGSDGHWSCKSSTTDLINTYDEPMTLQKLTL
jgi:hypothetical protein